MMRSLRLPLLPLLVLLGAAASARAADDPHYVVQVQPLEKLLKTAKEVARKFATPQLGKEAAEEKTSTEIEEQLTKTLGRGWREAIDERRPILLYGRLSGEAKERMPVLLLPVKSATAAREHLKERKLEIEDSDNGCQMFLPPGMKEPVYFRFAHDYLCATQGSSAPLAEEALLAPGKLLQEKEKAAVVARLYIDRLPSDYVDRFNKGFHEGYEKGFQQAAPKNLPPPVNEALGKWQKSIEDLTRSITQNGKELVLRLDLDAASGEARAALRLTAKPDSDLARTLADLRPGPSLGAALVGGQPLAGVHAHLVLPGEVSRFLQTMLRQNVKNALARIEDEKMQGAFNDLATAIEPTIEEGILDTALAMHGPGQNKRCGVVLSLQLKKARELEKAVKKVIGFLPANSPFGLLRMDVDTIADTKVHRYPLGEIVPEPMKKLFGKGTAVLAFREDGLVLAYGEKADEHLEKALTAQPGRTPPVLLHADGDTRKLVDLALQYDPRDSTRAQELADMFPDRVRVLHLSLAGGEALEMRAAVNVILMPRAPASKPEPKRTRPPVTDTPPQPPATPPR